ncbi:MAG: family 20 glycosylhydrolase [Chitinophagaceae bacterium]
MKILIAFILISPFALAQQKQVISIIPQPAEVVLGTGKFILSDETIFATRSAEDKKAADYLNSYLQQFYGIRLDVDKQEGKNYIRLNTRSSTTDPLQHGYTLRVSEDGVTIDGNSHTGTFYGLQTLIQLLPVPDSKSQIADSFKRGSTNKFQIPFVTIRDQPQFAYRGMHLDVSRHFFPVSFVKKYIDYLALHKMNYFHWHLTEDQGWRIEIKKYPRLTEVGAYRNGTIVGRYPGTANDNIRYGGYYTQDEIRDIVQYAADRHITVVPEIEMPGHSSAAIASYPFLSCFPGKETVIPTKPSEISKNSGGKKVQETWGIFEDVYCAGNDSVFTFLEGVMDEVLQLFPSKYIHVGGDECPKTHWKKCPKCQTRIKAEGLKDEHELQSYFIQRMEKYLNSKGRTLIGWDEILEGGLAPNAVVMSWRGEKGGIEAAKEKHDVVMTPGTHCYFDHTQSTNEDSIVFGGFTPVEKVYSYQPVPQELSTEFSKYVLGAQGNVWTEYMKYPSKVEYMIFPRMSALSEVLWSLKEKRNWDNFENRLTTQFNRYDLWKANYSRAYYDIKTSILPSKGYKGLNVKFETKDKSGKLLYGVAGKHFARNYTTPIVINEPAEITGLYYRDNKMLDSVTIKLNFNKATGKKITVKEEPSKNYPGDGAFTLVNGVHNSTGLSRGREFLGYNGGDMEAVIDLGTPQKISNVIVHTLNQEGSWIYRPSSVEVFASSDGKKYTSIGRTTEFSKTTGNNGLMKVQFPVTTKRYLKVAVKNFGEIPDGKPGAGNKGWLFADEIEVN